MIELIIKIKPISKETPDVLDQKCRQMILLYLGRKDHPNGLLAPKDL